MKKVLAVLAALTLPAAALADNSQGFYVQGDLGHASVKAKAGSAKATEKGFSPRVSVGYDFGDFRVAADYTHYKTVKENIVTPRYTESYKGKFQSVGVSAIYDFDLGYQVKPYVGARLGFNRVSNDGHIQGVGYASSVSSRETKTGLGVMTGVGYDVTDNIALDAGYRYNHWGKFDGVKVNSHEFSAGVRVKF